MRTLKESTPVAQKEHVCCLCNCKIEKGKQYIRQVNVDEAYGIVDVKCHTECHSVASDLDMFSECDCDGLSDAEFEDTIDQYVYDEHYDQEIDDISKDWQMSSLYEKVKKIFNELKTEQK